MAIQSPLGNRATSILDFIGNAFGMNDEEEKRRQAGVVVGGPIQQPSLNVGPMQFGEPQNMEQLQVQQQMQEQNTRMPQIGQQTAVQLPDLGTKETELMAADAAVRQMAAGGDQDPGFMDKVKNYFGDEGNMLRLAMAFNTMRMNPDQQLAAYAAKRLETIGAQSKNKTTVAKLRAMGTPAALKAADYIENTGDAKGGMKLYSEFGSVITGSGADLAKKYGVAGLDPDKAYNYDTLTGKTTGIGGGDTNVIMDTYNKEMATILAKDINDARTNFIEAGKQASTLANSYARVLGALDFVDTGKFAENKQKVRTFLEGMGLDGFINMDEYGSSQELIAATNQLVAEELRKNKGSQTDFDALFASQYLPSLDKQSDANYAIANYAVSHANFDQLLGRAANQISLRDEDAEARIRQLNAVRMNFSAFIQTADGTPEYFNEFYKFQKANGADDLEIIDAWMKYTDEQRQYLNKMR
jgi:hypothetical protein